MWWERWIPESYLTKSAVCGVECVYNDAGISYNYVVLENKKKKLIVSQKGNTSAISDLTAIAKKASAPLTLAITGKGVIVKKVIFSENDSVSLPDLLNQHFPAIPFSEFYVQFYKNSSNSGHIAVCRKTQVNELIKELTKDKTELVNVFLGPFICNALSAITAGYNRLSTTSNQLELSNGFIESVMPLSETSQNDLAIDDLVILPEQTVCFAAGFSYLTKQTNYNSDNSEITQLPLQHSQKLKVRLLLFVVISVIFIISGVNSVLFFQKFEENNALEVELNLYESKNNQITQLLDNYQKKKNLIEQAGIFENKKMSVYADRIAASLPNDILLRELYFNPEEGETEEDSLTNFTENQLIIKGNCSKSLLLNDWINILKSQNFIKGVNLETFIYNSEGHLPNFVLKVDTK